MKLSTTKIMINSESLQTSFNVHWTGSGFTFFLTTFVSCTSKKHNLTWSKTLSFVKLLTLKYDKMLKINAAIDNSKAKKLYWVNLHRSPTFRPSNIGIVKGAAKLAMVEMKAHFDRTAPSSSFP